MFTIQFTREAIADLRRFQKPVGRQILAALES